MTGSEVDKGEEMNGVGKERDRGWAGKEGEGKKRGRNGGVRTEEGRARRGGGGKRRRGGKSRGIHIRDPAGLDPDFQTMTSS